MRVVAVMRVVPMMRVMPMVMAVMRRQVGQRLGEVHGGQQRVVGVMVVVVPWAAALDMRLGAPGDMSHR